MLCVSTSFKKSYKAHHYYGHLGLSPAKILWRAK